jgi:uncharacterized protein YdeI (YjbR/CyaY-like superfamily)
LRVSPRARDAFEAMPPSHRREYCGYVDEAKKPETREKRAWQAIPALEKWLDEREAKRSAKK